MGIFDRFDKIKDIKIRKQIIKILLFSFNERGKKSEFKYLFRNKKMIKKNKDDNIHERKNFKIAFKSSKIQ